MTRTTIDELGVDITGNGVGLDRALARAERQTEGSRRAIGASLAGLDRNLAGFDASIGGLARLFGGLGTVGVAAATGLGVAIRGAADKMGDLVDASERLGIGIEALQEFRFAALDAGLSAETLDAAMAKLAVKAANGDPMFKRLGVSVRNADGTMRSLEDVFADTVARASSLTDEQERLAVATDLFGKGAGPQMVLLLNQGTDGMERLRAKARDLGVVIDEGVVRNADEAAKKLDALSAVMDVQMTAALAAMAPKLAALVTHLVTLIQRLNDFDAAFQRVSDLGEGAVDRNLYGIYDDRASNPQLAGRVQTLRQELAGIEAEIADAMASIDEGGGQNELLQGAVNNQLTVLRGKRDELLTEVGRLSAILAQRHQSRGEPPAVPPAGGGGTLPPAPGAAPRERTVDADAEIRRQADIEMTVASLLRQADALNAEAAARGQGAEAFAAWNREAEIANKTAAFRERLIDALAKSEGSIAVNVDEATQAYEKAVRAAGDAAAAMEDGPLQDLKQAFTDAGRDLSSSLVDALQGADIDGAEILKRFGGRVLELALQVQFLDGLMKRLGMGSGSGAGGSGGSDIWGLLAQGVSLIGGIMGVSGGGSYGTGSYTGMEGNYVHRAVGGRGIAGQPMEVGEMGREVFVPDSPGRVLSAQDLRQGGGGGGAPQITFAPAYNIDARGSQMTEAQFRAILDENNRSMKADLERNFGNYSATFNDMRG